MRSVLAIATMAAVLAIGAYDAQAYKENQSLTLPAGQTRVVRVIDGDTIAVSDLRAHVRLKGIDAAEIHKGRNGYKCDAELELGQKAKARMEELLSPPHKVVVKHTKDMDQYGRRVAIVTSDGKDAGQILVQEGLAKEWDGNGPRPDFCSEPAPTPTPPTRPRRG
jgi:endonuclease YncB( thermonuclease family)